MKTSELQGAALDWAVIKCERPHLHPEGTQHVIPKYSTNWAQGGPIIEREISCLTDRQDDTMPTAWSKSGGPGVMGPTKLIAAMRCYVASKLGDEVEIPEELK